MRALAQRPLTGLLLILLIKIVLSVPSVTLPTWRWHENDFYNVARTLVNEGRLPTPEDFPNDTGVQLQATQPPLYYALIYPIVRLLDSDLPVPPPRQPDAVCLGWTEANPQSAYVSDAALYRTELPNPDLARSALRGFSLLLSLAGIVFVYWTVLTLAPGRYIAALLAAALLAFESNLMTLGAQVNNDALFLFLACAHVLVAVRLVTHRARAWEWLLLGAITLLALVTRLNGWILVAVSLLVVAAAVLDARWKTVSPKLRRRLLIGSVVSILLVAGIMVVNYFTVGSFLGRYNDLETIFFSIAPYLTQPDRVMRVIGAVSADTISSYNTAFVVVQRPRLISLIGVGTLAMMGVGLTMLLLRRKSARMALLLVWYCVVTILFVFLRNGSALATITEYSTVYIHAPVRYYLSMAPAFVVLLALGFDQTRWARLIGLGLVAVWVAALVVNLLLVPQVAPIPVLPSEQRLPTVEFPNSTDEAGFPAVVSAHWSLDPMTTALVFRMVNSIREPLSQDLIAQLDFESADLPALRCQFTTANGTYPPRFWRNDEQIATSALVPNCLPTAQPADARVVLRWVGDGVTSDPIDLGELGVSLPRSAICPPLLGVVDNTLAVTQYTAALTFSRNEGIYLPGVNWYVLGVPRAVTRSYTMTHESGSPAFSCGGIPRQGTFPFGARRLGETIFFDDCIISIPPDAPTGAYAVTLMTYDAQNSVLPVVDASGEDDAGALPIATVQMVP